MRNTLVAGLLGMGKTTQLKRLVTKAYKKHYEVIIFDITGEFRVWVKTYSNQIVNGESVNINDIHFDKPIDINLEPALLNNNLYNTVQYLLSSLIAKLNQQLRPVCLVFPEAEKYMDSTNPQSVKYLDYFNDALKSVYTHKGIVLMDIPSIKGICSKENIHNSYGKAISLILTHFKILELFRLISDDILRLNALSHDYLKDNYSLNTLISHISAELPYQHTDILYFE